MTSKVSNSFEQTQEFGKEFSKSLKGGSVVCLYGDLGAGKTTFVQGMARGLGIKKRIVSPTFIIVRRYEIKVKSQKSKVKNAIQNAKVFYHIDLYRIDTSQQTEDLGLEEIFDDKNAIVAIEWAEKLGKKLPKERTDIYFESIDDDKRQIIWK